ncbi:MBL fold metallo-hydrolase [Tessaracoccus sp. OS52]|uniref:MBL fold metallo-hydrolase RNA specificity domain-containing protein n=1 Tax=Tessaracoccus sp. OS52 TaxID=2886691 RepID=UPI001D0FEF10|nr:MBL fold metallo-hydrolase [Tessaracoccus sp. OS52]MCC2594198.1 MBL fold metallo-hydrolase [Tessaracoccus sp. OS52]
MTTPVTLQFLGASGTVTGSKYLVEFGERRLVVDAGMYQGSKELRLRNREPFAVDASTVDFIVVTHAHADHTSYLPALVNQGFDRPIWCTEGTARLAEIVLRDSAHLQELETENARQGGYSKHPDPEPLYTKADAERTIEMFRTVEFDTDVDLGHGVVGRWTRAGHILASASVNLTVGGVDVLFSGDLGRDRHPLMRARDTPPGAQWVLCESTYGDREHEEPAVAHVAMAEAITRTVERGGSVVIPAFAIDRTQAVMHAVVQLQREGRIPEVPVLVDGPMSMRALDVYRDMPEELAEGLTVDDFVGLKRLEEIRTSRQSREARNDGGSRIIISSSGMLEGGRVLSWLQKLLPDPKNCVILAGYQGEGTRGRALIEGARHLKINGRHVPVKAELVDDREFSAHAGASELVAWVASLNPRPETVFLVHGEPGPAAALEQRIEDELGIPTVVASHGEKVLLSEPIAAVEVDDEA